MSMSACEADCVVIGGGAAGMMAAITAGERGRRVLLLEHEKFCGRKLRITGKGRCNLCNNCDIRSLLAHVPHNAKFLQGCLHRFGPAETMSFFEESGVPLKTERGSRVFPQSDRAHDVANALEKRMRRAGVRFHQAAADSICVQDGRVTGVVAGGQKLSCESVLIATGGMSYPLTGSTGDGYVLARALGHRVVPPRPSLVPLECAEPDCAQMQGFSLKNVRLTAIDDRGERVYSDLGELLFTHFGVSGPLVLSASAYMREFEARRWHLEIDLKPGLDGEQLDARILRDFAKFRNREFQNALSELAGRSMIPVLVARSGIPPETKVHSITREQRRRLAELFKAFSLTVTGTRGFSEAIVTAGGVDVTEVDPRSMRSRLVPGLFFAGEVLDVDACTGGFNLQIAWSTGHAAGERL
ncbi:MAG: NAD(P)/FAD-dependent oxidoreductase [Oscillospiraceae bacterium]|nr:NAD(P)/FAD-dependent oxidoreductase [Oscillospiraceae bacterium]